MSDCLDPARLATQGARLEGEFPVGVLARIQDVSPEASGPVRYDLRFMRDPAGAIRLEVRVAAQLQLRCERCLEPMPWDVRSETVVAVVFSDDQAREVAGDLEPLVADAEGRLSLRALVEDEILMALPLAPVHEHPCGRQVQEHHPEMVAAEAAEDHPFAALAALKKSY